jgi:hypothetical protein
MVRNSDDLVLTISGLERIKTSIKTEKKWSGKYANKLL